MKQIFIVTIMLISAIKSPLLAQQDIFIKEYLERFENSRKYLNLVAEMMPEDKYNFRATPESKSFAENLLHIGKAMDWHSQSLIGGRPARDNNIDTTFHVENKSKKDMIAIINKTFDEATELIKQFDTAHFDDRLDYSGLDRTKRQILLLLADHISHHRGQMLVYLRLNGLEPPKYMEFQ